MDVEHRPVVKNLISGHLVTTPMAESAPSGSLRGYLGLFRLGNCVMGAFGALLAAIVAGGTDGLEEYPVEILLSMGIVVLFTGAGNSLNDYYDRDVDKVAHPDRPIPKGLVRPKDALALSVVMFAATVIMSVFVNLWSFSIVVTSIVIMVGYESLLKAEGLAGNLAISWLTGALFLFGGVAVDRMELAWILAALAFLATLGREIVKDIQDIEGDRGSRRTLPMRIGPRSSGAVASGAFIGAVVLSPVPYLLDLLSVWYLAAVVVADGIFIYCALIHFRNPERGQKTAKLAMLAALAAFLLGGVY